MKKQFLSFILLSLPVLASPFSSFPEEEAFAYAPNAGWIHFRHDQPAAPAGVIIGETFLSGEAWAPNFGWIYFGSGAPADGKSYGNDSATDYGVNRTPDGQLQGRAWAPNIGWIHFDASKGNPQIDLLTGAVRGSAWAPNIGWIDLKTGLLTANSLDTRDLDEDGIPDDWEMLRFGNLTQATATGDSDKDGTKDADEYLAGTDPNDADSALKIISFSTNDTRTETKIDFTSSLGRIYRLHTSETLDGWTADTQHGLFHGDNGTTRRALTHAAGAKLFFRVSARPPFTPEPPPSQ